MGNFVHKVRNLLFLEWPRWPTKTTELRIIGAVCLVTLSSVAATPAPGSNAPGPNPAAPGSTQSVAQPDQVGKTQTGSVKGDAHLNPGGGTTVDAANAGTLVMSGVFALAAVVSFVMLVNLTFRGERVAFETHWGGLGGGISGLGATQALSFLFLTIFFSLLLFAVSIRYVSSPTASSAVGGATNAQGQARVPDAGTK